MTGGALELACALDGARTVVRTLRAEGLARASLLPGRDGAAQVQVATLGPGMLAGDAFAVHGVLDAGATLLVQGQMATPIFAGARAARAAVRWEIADGATLCAIAQPVVPEPGSASALRTELTVAGDGCAILTDTLVIAAAAGLRSTTLAHVDGALALRDALDLRDASGTGAVGTVYAIARDPALRAGFAAGAWALLDAQRDVRGGVGETALAVVVRLRGAPFAVHETSAVIAHALLVLRQTFSSGATASGCSDAVAPSRTT